MEQRRSVPPYAPVRLGKDFDYNYACEKCKQCIMTDVHTFTHIHTHTHTVINGKWN